LRTLSKPRHQARGKRASDPVSAPFSAPSCGADFCRVAPPSAHQSSA
jgi:hypothetical protein